MNARQRQRLEHLKALQRKANERRAIELADRAARGEFLEARQRFKSHFRRALEREPASEELMRMKESRVLFRRFFAAMRTAQPVVSAEFRPEEEERIGAMIASLSGPPFANVFVFALTTCAGPVLRVPFREVIRALGRLHVRNEIDVGLTSEDLAHGLVYEWNAYPGNIEVRGWGWFAAYVGSLLPNG